MGSSRLSGFLDSLDVLDFLDSLDILEPKTL